MKTVRFAAGLLAALLLLTGCQTSSLNTENTERSDDFASASTMLIPSEVSSGSPSATEQKPLTEFILQYDRYAFEIGMMGSDAVSALPNAEKTEDQLVLSGKAVTFEYYADKDAVFAVEKDSGKLVLVKLTASSVATTEGIAVGATIQRVTAVYGEASVNDSGYLSYTLSGTELRIYIDNGCVSAIFYLDTALFGADEPESNPIKSAVFVDLDGKVTIEDFLKRTNVHASFVTDITGIDYGVEGEYSIEILCAGKNYTTTLYVTDLTAPTAMPVEGVEIVQGGVIKPEALVKDVFDRSNVTFTFKEQPSSEKLGEIVVTVVLTDAKGNVAEIPVKVKIIVDTVPPTITSSYGVVRTICLGETVSYKKGITVTDNSGVELGFEVDASAVNLNVIGTYPVIYTATDASGNKGTLKVMYMVVEDSASSETDENIYAFAEVFLNEVVFNGRGDTLSDYMKCKKIYWWVMSTLGYSGTSEKKDWIGTGYKVLTGKIGMGDCFTYYSAAKLLLTVAGIENIDVRKVPNYEGDSNHYWSMVYVYGAWYHFDCSPRSPKKLEEKTGLNYRDGSPFLLFTDAEMDAVSVLMNNCFNRDMSLYPATPDTPLPEEFKK